MNTKELCLGALLMGDASGYEIKGLFEDAFRHFQRVSFGSIYPALNSLAEEGQVNFKNEVQSGRPDKKTYSITDEGRSHFQKVIRKAEPKESFQSDFLILVLFSRSLNKERYEEVIDTYIEDLSQQVTELKALIQEENDCLTREARFTIDFGIHVVTAQIDFVRQNKAQLLTDHSTNTVQDGETQ